MLEDGTATLAALLPCDLGDRGVGRDGPASDLPTSSATDVAEPPVIELYKHDKDNTVERECEYVYSAADYQAWLAAAREPLRSASILAHDGGICRGELLAVQWDCVKLNKAADENGFWGAVEIRRGLKRKERRRDLPITEDMAAVLLSLKAQAKCQYVFTSMQDRTQPLSVNTLADRHRTIMETCTFHPDAGLHARCGIRSSPKPAAILRTSERCSDWRDTRGFRQRCDLCTPISRTCLRLPLRYSKPRQRARKLRASLQFSLHPSNSRRRTLVRCRI